MKRGLTLAAVVVLVMTGSVARADDKSHKAAAENLLKAMDTEKNLQSAIDLSLEMQLKQNPQLEPVKGVLKKFLTKHLSYASLKDDMIKMYTEEFSEEDLKKAVEFYSTPTGKKLASKMPVLLQKGSELGAKRVQENSDELRKLIEDELKKDK